jgi:hypothetical protein
VANFVTHRVWAQGPDGQIQKLIENHFVEYKSYRGTTEKHLDFETIIPPPFIIKQTQSGSCSDRGAYLLAVLSGEVDYQQRYDKMIGRQESESVETAIRRFFRENPEYEKFGGLQRQCLEETGLKDWYAWNNQYWETKWNACEGKIGHVLTHDGTSRMEFTLDTAWSVPRLIWAKLAEMFPEIVFEIAFLDEGWNFAGSAFFNGRDEEDGFEYYTPDPQCRHWRNFFQKVYGREYIRFDEADASCGE